MRIPQTTQSPPNQRSEMMVWPVLCAVVMDAATAKRPTPANPPKTTTPGGRGLKFYASLRLEFDLGGAVKDKIEDFLTGEEINALVGNKVYVKCVKNKVGIPGRTVELRSRYGMGFDNAWSALQILIGKKLVNKTGAWFTFSGKKVPFLTGDANATELKLQGEQAVLDYADQNPVWRDSLIQLARQQLATITDDQLVEAAE